MNQALQSQEVQNALKVLPQHGLGAVDIHMHNDEGDIIPLKEGVVQLEKDLQVSFVSQNDTGLMDATPVRRLAMEKRWYSNDHVLRKKSRSMYY